MASLSLPYIAILYNPERIAGTVTIIGKMKMAFADFLAIADRLPSHQFRWWDSPFFQRRGFKFGRGLFDGVLNTVADIKQFAKHAQTFFTLTANAQPLQTKDDASVMNLVLRRSIVL